MTNDLIAKSGKTTTPKQLFSAIDGMGRENRSTKLKAINHFYTDCAAAATAAEDAACRAEIDSIRRQLG